MRLAYSFMSFLSHYLRLLLHFSGFVNSGGHLSLLRQRGVAADGGLAAHGGLAADRGLLDSGVVGVVRRALGVLGAFGALGHLGSFGALRVLGSAADGTVEVIWWFERFLID